MTESEQAEHFGRELRALCNRYAEEYQLRVYAIIGMLHSQAYDIAFEALSEPDDDEIEGDEEK